jgi:hypothetical protein
LVALADPSPAVPDCPLERRGTGRATVSGAASAFRIAAIVSAPVGALNARPEINS